MQVIVIKNKQHKAVRSTPQYKEHDFALLQAVTVSEWDVYPQGGVNSLAICPLYVDISCVHVETLACWKHYREKV